MYLQLNNNFSFAIEPDNKRLRLIAMDGGTELACRKETAKNLLRFIDSEQTQLFKGRLQLYKQNDMVSVLVKGQVIGELPVNSLKQMLA